MNRIYTLLFYAAIPFILLRLWWKGRKLDGYRQRIGERFGLYRTPKLSSSIWLHAVSYGETVAAEPLINKLLENHPDTPLLITNMTITGSQRVRSSFGERVCNIYVPYDLPLAVNRFLHHFNPKFGIIMETELWPNLFRLCKKNNIPVMIANARLSKKSTRGYSRIKHLVKNTLSNINIISVQSRTDGKRYQALGASTDRIFTTGNLKCDMSPPEKQITLAKQVRDDLPNPRPIFIAASTHDGEETLVLQAFNDIKHRIPHCLLILVPRHPNRFDEVSSLCETSNFKVVKKSQHPTISNDVDILLGDTMGEMMYFYSLADVAFVGGSLVPIGGHNLLEPTSVSVPIITGPHLFNTAGMQRFFPKDSARIEVHDAKQLAAAAITLLQDEERRHDMVNLAQKRWAESRGALERTLKLIDQLAYPT